MQEESVFQTTPEPAVQSLITGQRGDSAQASEYAVLSGPPPISRIPVELLVEIFTWIPQFHPFLTWENNENGPPWVAVTHVCRYWRRVALESRDLWTDIPLASLRWTEVALQRSNPAPITLNVDSNLHPLARLYDSVPRALQELSRVKSLTIFYAQADLGQEAATELINLLSNSPAPVLETLSLSFPVEGDAPFHIPNDVFNSIAPPNLREVNLFGCWLSATSPILRAPLRSLDISHQCLIWFTIDQVIETLSALPTLEELRADCSTLLLDSSLSRSRHRRRCIDLPRLKLLELGDNFSQVIVMFHYMRIPLTSQLSIRSSSLNPIPITDHPLLEETLKYHFSSAIQEDKAFWNVSFERGSRSMTVECDGLQGPQPWGTSYTILSPIDGIARPPVEVPREFSLSTPVEWAEPEIVSTFLKLPIFKNCHHLMVREFSEFLEQQAPPDPAFWGTFSEFSNVEELEIFGRAAYSFAEVYNAPEPLVLFPNLGHLVIRDADFAGWRMEGERSYSQTSFFGCLLTALHARMESTTVAPLKTVEVAECDVEPRMIKILQVVLGEVKVNWDEKQGRMHDHDEELGDLDA